MHANSPGISRTFSNAAKSNDRQSIHTSYCHIEDFLLRSGPPWTAPRIRPTDPPQWEALYTHETIFFCDGDGARVLPCKVWKGCKNFTSSGSGRNTGGRVCWLLVIHSWVKPLLSHVGVLLVGKQVHESEDAAGTVWLGKRIRLVIPTTLPPGLSC